MSKVYEYCTGVAKDNIECQEYHRDQTSSIGPLVQYMLCGSTVKCDSPRELNLRYLKQDVSVGTISVSAIRGMNATMLIDEAKRYMTIYNQPVLLTFDDYADRTFVSIDKRPKCQHTIPCLDDLTKKCCFQDSPIRTLDGNYHSSNMLYSTGKLKSVVVVGWNDNYPIPHSTEKGALIVRDEGASTGHSIDFFSREVDDIVNANEDFINCGNNHSFISWTEETPLHMNYKQFIKYLSEAPAGIDENNVHDYTFYLINHSTPTNQGLMDVTIDFVGPSSDSIKLESVTVSMVEMMFYEEIPNTRLHECGFYAIGYNTIQRYFTYHYDTKTNPVGFSFIHLKWPDDSDDLIRK